MPAGAGEPLSERLMAFRDSDGRYGLIDEFCAHRGVSLWFGRNEESGLRCPYHGWKYDVTGQCIEVPSEPMESGFCKKIKLTSYPLVERGGVLWTYMGPPEQQPPLPEWEFAGVTANHRFVAKRTQECNWLQAMEGGIDSSHVSFLHSGELDSDPLFKGSKGNQYNLNDMKPHFEVTESPGGLYIGARRNAENGNYYWRITPWVMPSFTMIPPRGDHPVHGHFWIPSDDENSWAWSFDYRVTSHSPPSRCRRCATAREFMSRSSPARSVPAEQGQRLSDRSRGAESRPHFSGVWASRCRMLRCRKAWAPSSTAARKTSFPRTTASSWRVTACCARRRRCEKGTLPPAPTLSISGSAPRRWCCRPTGRSRTPRRTRWWCRPARSTRRSSPCNPKSARMSSAAEARFRIDAPNSLPRAVKVIALDQPSERRGQDRWRMRPLEPRDVLYGVGPSVARRKPARASPAGCPISPATPRISSKRSTALIWW